MNNSRLITLHLLSIPLLLLVIVLSGYYLLQNMDAQIQRKLSLYKQSQVAKTYIFNHAKGRIACEKTLHEYEKAKKSSLADLVTSEINNFSCPYGNVALISSGQQRDGAQFKLQGYSASLMAFISQLEHDHKYLAINNLDIEKVNDSQKKEMTNNPLEMTLIVSLVQPLKAKKK